MYIDDELQSVLVNNKAEIMNGIFGVQTSVQVEASVSFARYMNYVGITRYNYIVFLKLLETNNKWVVDALLDTRNPSLLFTVLKPNSFLIKKAFDLISHWHPGQIYPKVLLAIMGIIEYSYYKPDDGYRIYSLEISDLNNLAKFLNQENDQFDPVNEILLDILDHITRLGEYHNEIAKSVIARHAYNLRIAYFDNTKSLLDVIPKVLMVKIPREEREIGPGREYQDFLIKTLSGN